jgi:hypothetical protein
LPCRRLWVRVPSSASLKSSANLAVQSSDQRTMAASWLQSSSLWGRIEPAIWRLTCSRWMLRCLAWRPDSLQIRRFRRGNPIAVNGPTTRRVAPSAQFPDFCRRSFARRCRPAVCASDAVDRWICKPEWRGFQSRTLHRKKEPISRDFSPVGLHRATGCERTGDCSRAQVE